MQQSNYPTCEAAPLQQIDRTYVRFQGRKLSYFAGCDYYRLASHPAVHAALKEGLKKYGLSVAASRMTTGNHELFGKLETELADFFGVASALLVAAGYLGDSIVAQGMRGEVSHVLIDEKSHPSLKDAARFLECPVIPFKHRDPDDLSRALSRLRKNCRPALFTDGMFASSGEFAPLKQYRERLPGSAFILADDAHGAGILGSTGKGTPEEEGVRDHIIQTITLSKAFGVYGGAILCPRNMREKLMSRSAMFAGCTPLPLPLANAARKSVSILKQDPGFRLRLRRNVDYVKAALRQKSIPVVANLAPIIRLIPRTRPQTTALRKRLLANKVFPSCIRYPGGSDRGYFRFVISSEHSKAQLDALLSALMS
jgi:7-keto-8-aminopelargonate synthetase-like enzyme